MASDIIVLHELRVRVCLCVCIATKIDWIEVAEKVETSRRTSEKRKVKERGEESKDG